MGNSERHAIPRKTRLRFQVRGRLYYTSKLTMDNVEAVQIFHATARPVAVTFSSEGNVTEVSFLSDSNSETASSHEEENLEYNLHKQLRTGTRQDSLSVAKSIQSMNEDKLTFFTCYLASEMGNLVGEAEYYVNMGKILYDLDSDSRFLYSKLVRNSSGGSTADIRLDSRTIDFGTIQNETKQMELLVDNIGDVPFLVYQCSVSCRCISVSFPSRPDPGSQGKIKITITPDGSEGEFMKNIILTTNSREGNLFITLTGTFER